MRNRMLCVLAIAALTGGLFGNAYGQSIGWRFDGTGRYPDAKPPAEWAGPTTQPVSEGKNILWATSMPDWSNASPILVDGKLFVQSEPFELLCVDAQTGRVLWTRSHDYSQVMTLDETEQARQDAAQAAALRAQIATAQESAKQAGAKLRQLAAQATQPDADADAIKRLEAAAKAEQAAANESLTRLGKRLAGLTKWEKPPANEVNGYSSPTPCSDGTFVYGLFGNGVAACYDLDGNRKWIRFVAKSTIEDGLSSSPVLASLPGPGTARLTYLLVHPDALTALDPATGATVWRAKNTEATYGTCYLAEIAGTKAAVTANGDVVRLADGAVLARKVSLCSYCSPIVEGDVAYFIQNISKGHGGGHVVRLAAAGPDALKGEVLWQTKSAKDRYYASPVLADGLIYTVTQKKVFSVIDARDGGVVKELQLILGKGTTFPSPCLAGDLLFVSHESGQTAVIRPGRDAEVLRTNTLEPFRATPLFIGGRVYIRGLRNLYCIGSK